MIEVWGKQTLWAGDTEAIVQDREGMKKQGYSPISGAYYSARLAVAGIPHRDPALGPGNRSPPQSPASTGRRSVPG